MPRRLLLQEATNSILRRLVLATTGFEIAVETSRMQFWVPRLHRWFAVRAIILGEPLVPQLIAVNDLDQLGEGVGHAIIRILNDRATQFMAQCIQAVGAATNGLAVFERTRSGVLIPMGQAIVMQRRKALDGIHRGLNRAGHHASHHCGTTGWPTV